MPKFAYIEAAPTDPADVPEFAYIEVAPTDEFGVMIPPALAAADGDLTKVLKDDLVNIATTRGVPAEGTKADIITALTKES